MTGPDDRAESEADAPSAQLAATVRAGDTGRGDPLPAPDADDRRDRELVKARLFRSRGGPVQIGRFTVLARLGEGGMGVVYTAYDDQLGRKVAVKLLRGDGRHDLVARARLLREAQAMARLSHANIVAVHEVGATEDQQVFIAMEFVRGETLDAWLKGQVHGWREILGEFIAAGRGLAAAHRAGLIHRDFKPHNVIVGEDGIVKVLDFGLARASERAEDAADRVEAPAAKERLLDVALTHAGAVMGTPAYMAPEQHEGRPATARSDQFSFCVSLYEGLYGRHPFDCTSLGSLLSDVAAGRVRPPPPGTRVPPWLHRVVLRGLEVDPARRWESMTDLLAELGNDPAARRRRWLTTAALTGLVGAASFAAASLVPAGAPACPDAAAALADVWSPARAEAVRKAMFETNVPYAADAWERVQPRLGAYAQAWVAMRGEVCEAHRAARQSDLLFELRSACLDTRRASLDALVDVLGEADAVAVEHAVVAAATLPAIAACGDSEALTRAPRPPAALTERARVQAHREALARAGALERLGWSARSLEVVGPIVADARRFDHPPLLAEALLRLGSAQVMSAPAEAEATLAEAMWTAISLGHSAVAAGAGARQLALRRSTGRAREALDTAPLVLALTHRVAGDAALAADVRADLGAAALAAGDLGRAHEHLHAALELERSLAPDTLVATLEELADLAERTGDRAAAIGRATQAVAAAQAAFGAGHPHTARARQHLARLSAAESPVPSDR